MNSSVPPDDQDEVSTRGLTRTVLRGVALAGGGFVLTQAITLGFYIALARLATPAEFGELAAGMALVGIALLYTEGGMLSALVYRRDRIEEAAATAVVSTFLAGLVLSLGALAAAPLLGLYFGDDTVGEVAAAVSGVLFFRTLAVVPNALLQRRFSFFRRLVVEPAAAIAFGATSVVLTARGMGVWGLVIGQYASVVVEAIAAWGLVHWRPNLRLASYGMWRELIAYGRHALVATTVIRIGQEVPVFLLGRFSGTAALGQFRYGIRIAQLPLSTVMAAASYVLFPALARISDASQRFHAAVLRCLRWMAIMAIFGGLVLIPLGRPLSTLVFGEIWAEAGTAAAALAFFCAGRALTSLIVEALKADGRPDVVVRMNLVELVVGVIAMVALLPFGLVGVCLGASLAVVVRTVYSFIRADRVMGIPLAAMWREIRPPLIAGIVMAAVVLPLELLVVDAASHGTALGLLLVVAEALLAVAIYVGVIHLLAPGAIREFVGLLRTARRQTPEAEIKPEPEPEETELPVVWE